MHCVISVQIRSFFWSVFSRIRSEYGVSLRTHSECAKIRTRKNSVFRHFSRSDEERTFRHGFFFYLSRILLRRHCPKNVVKSGGWEKDPKEAMAR